ncbi:MAG: DUF3990 domain-containing protein [Paludibacteraceae bacterium]|nr:DUF3990 domain-containing protein [Paludibacteraceae bacterium]
MWNDEYVLYHGSTVVVREPLTHVGRPDLDFGPGFYLTNDREQAVSWALTKAARKKNRKAVLNVYLFERNTFSSVNEFRSRIFPFYDKEWLDFIAASRKGKQPWAGYDWIEGGIANDSVITTVEAYVDGFISAETALGKLINENLKHQVCIGNQVIIDKYLSFVEAVEL